MPDAIAGTEQNLFLILGGDVGTISVLRVVHLLLERLGTYLQESRQAQLLSEVCALMCVRVWGGLWVEGAWGRDARV
jgi:hypothetical protein